MLIDEMVESYAEARKAIRLGRLLKRARERKSLRLNDVAKAAHVSPSALSHAESGRQTLSYEVLELVANALEEDADTLLERVGLSQPEYRSRTYEVLELVHGPPVAQYEIALRYLQNCLSARDLSSDEESTIVMSGVTAIASMPVLVNEMLAGGVQSREQASRMLLMLLEKNFEVALPILGATVRALIVRDWEHDTTVDFDEVVSYLPADKEGHLVNALAEAVSRAPRRAPAMLQAGFTWGIAGFFVLPVATAIASDAAVSRRVRRALTQWSKSSDDPRSQRVIERTTTVAAGLRKLARRGRSAATSP